MIYKTYIKNNDRYIQGEPDTLIYYLYSVIDKTLEVWYRYPIEKLYRKRVANIKDLLHLINTIYRLGSIHDVYAVIWYNQHLLVSKVNTWQIEELLFKWTCQSRNNKYEFYYHKKVYQQFIKQLT